MDETGEQMANDGKTESRPDRFKLRRALPTDRLKFAKQIDIVKGYGAESGASRRAVTLEKVAKAADIAQTSVGLNNEFFRDIGLIAREGKASFRPAQAVIDFLQASQWDPANALKKLGPLFANSWAGQALTARLAVRNLTKSEAIALLADESGASKDHADRLAILLDFLDATGVITVDGTTVRRRMDPVGESPEGPPPDERRDAARDREVDDDVDDQDVERFTIPIPNKRAATIIVPRDLDDDDWQMLAVMIETYITRLKNKRIRMKKEGGPTDEGS